MKLNAVFEQQDGLYVSAAVSGHAEYESGSEEGMILCAAVSSAMQLTCNTLTECLDAPDPVQSELLHGLLIHLQVLAEDYNGMMSVKIRRV